MKRFDFGLFIIVVLVTLFGLLMIYDASSFISFRDFGNKYYYFQEQSAWIVLGFISLFFFSYFDYHRFHTLALPLLILAILLLLLVFIPGIGISVYGAHRWIDLKFTVVQPAEFVKLVLAIYLSAWFSTKEKERFMAFLVLIGSVMLLVMLEPDMGTAIIILAEAFTVYYLSGGNIIQFVFVAPIIAVVGFILIKLEPYRAKRLTSFLSLGDSLETSSYHVKQILIALGSGGLTGVGLGNSIQKYAYLPENTTDSIFAIIAEEVGFIGSVVLIFFLIAIVLKGFFIASRARDAFGRLLAGGITAFLAMQMIINLGAQTALIPLTGVPLPFISYGGSALIVDLTAIGILLNIAKQSNMHVNV